MCKKQTSVSHSSTAAETISLDASLRMDGIPALDLWNLVIEVFHSSKKNYFVKPKVYRYRETCCPTPHQTSTRNQTKVPTKHDNLDWCHVDNVPSNAKFSQSSAVLNVFEDNEAVIKMIIKGRSPTMRHVSRTHRVALDWLFDSVTCILRFKLGTSTPNIRLQTY